jgi:hypothetical protein
MKNLKDNILDSLLWLKIAAHLYGDKGNKKHFS